MNLANSILKAIESALTLWKTHLEKRKEIYEIKLNKQRNKALNYAEDGFIQAEELFRYMINNADMEERQWKIAKDMYKDLKKIHKKFNKYD